MTVTSGNASPSFCSHHAASTKKAGVIFVNGEPFVANQMSLWNMRLRAVPSLLVHRFAHQRLRASASSSLATHPPASALTHLQRALYGRHAGNMILRRAAGFVGAGGKLKPIGMKTDARGSAFICAAICG